MVEERVILELASKIVIVGTSGSGKSTLARRLSQILNARDVELDALFWEAGWTEAPLDVFRARILEATSEKENRQGWVVHGNFNKVLDLTWGRADTVIWLDYSFPIVFWRVLKRTIMRSLTRELVCNGNRESLYKAFFTRGSILLWVLKTYWRRKREYPERVKDPKYAHLKVLHFTHPSETENFLNSLKASPKSQNQTVFVRK